ncbi:MAG: tRNA (N6-threonylcarbamoyladenosine(37)-N6)-methyltransferase TrmO [Pseudomonadota bacterium]
MEFDTNIFPLDVRIKPIGLIHSCFTGKFGIPRQPGMVPSAIARLELLPPCNREEMVRGLEQFTHIWIHFLFHQTVAEGWKPTIRPPWLGGRKRVGVFASRSPHRPNHLGLSVVKLEAIVKEKGSVFLDLSGVDFLDQTPVFDIKPYIPYSDCLPSASCGYAQGEQTEARITFSLEALDFCGCYQRETGRNLEQLIREMIRHDPRPASQKKHKSWFGMLLWDVNIRWCIDQEGFRVAKCIKIQNHETFAGAKKS